MKPEINDIKKNALGKNIKRLRKEHNISQEDLAQKLFISRTAISKWESGATEANIEFLMKMASIFNVDLDELITDEKKVNVKKVEVITKPIKPIVKKKEVQSFRFDKSGFSEFPNNKKETKAFRALILFYSFGITLLLAGFYLTVIVLAVWGRLPDPTNKYTLQILGGIPLMIIGIVLTSIALRKHLYLGTLKRNQYLNCSVEIIGENINVKGNDEDILLNRKDITSVSTYYEKLPSSIWKQKSISPLVVELHFVEKKLSVHELTDYTDIKRWIEVSDE